MHSFDFISQSPSLFIFQKEANKTNLGGILFLIYILICFGIFLFYLLDYLNNEKFEIQYTFNYNLITNDEYKQMLNDDELNPYIDYVVQLKDENDRYLSDNFIISNKKELIHSDGPGLKYSGRASEIELDVLYKCINATNCNLREEDKRYTYFIKFGYSYKFMFHQNNSSPVQKRKGIYEMKTFQFSFYNVIKKNLEWQIFRYKDIGGLFSNEKEYIGGSIKSGDIYIYDYFYSKDLPYLNKTDKYVHLYTIKVNNNLEYYDEYIRTKVTWLTIFANSFSLWMSFYSGLKFIFEFIYANNFNNYKIIQEILSKSDKGKLKEENNIELSSDFNKSNELINNQIDEKNIITKDDLTDKEKLIENSDDYHKINNEDDSIVLPKLHFFDYLFNNFYGSRKCFCDYKKQMMISTSNQILYKYFSVENILYNQIKIENLLKDYKWNNPRLKSIGNNELISQLKNYLFNI